jgi:hypothetical protein
MKTLLKFLLPITLISFSLNAAADMKCWVMGYEKDGGSRSELLQVISKEDAIKFFRQKNPNLRKIAIDGECDTNIPEIFEGKNLLPSNRSPASLKAESNASLDKKKATEVRINQANRIENSTKADSFEQVIENSVIPNLDKLDMSKIDKNDPASMFNFLLEAGKVVNQMCDSIIGPREREIQIRKNKSYPWRVQAAGVNENVVTAVAQTGWDECTGAAVFSISHKTRGASGSSTIKCGFGEANYLSSTSVKAKCF